MLFASETSHFKNSKNMSKVKRNLHFTHVAVFVKVVLADLLCCCCFPLCPKKFFWLLFFCSYDDFCCSCWNSLRLVVVVFWYFYIQIPFINPPCIANEFLFLLDISILAPYFYFLNLCCALKIWLNSWRQTSIWNLAWRQFLISFWIPYFWTF